MSTDTPLSTEQQNMYPRPPRPLTEKYRRVPIAELTEPTDGYVRVIRNAWWHVTENDEVLFYQVRSRGVSFDAPQCNRVKNVVDMLPIEGCTSRQIPIVYLPHRCET
jgi:hypothetical protein